MGDIVCRNWARLCLQISLMMRLQKLYFHCFHRVNLLAAWNWFWMPFICHWAEVKSKTMIHHILLTHLFIAQLLLLSRRRLGSFPKETESTFHFLLNWWKFNRTQVQQSSTAVFRWQLQRGRGAGAGLGWDQGWAQQPGGLSHFVLFYLLGRNGAKLISTRRYESVQVVISGKVMWTQQYHCFDLWLKSYKTRLLFDWQPCQRVNEDWHSNIENAAFTKLKARVFSWHCCFFGRLNFTFIFK